MSWTVANVVLLLAVLDYFAIVHAQDLGIYGLVTLFSTPLDPAQVSKINRHCFQGIGFITCQQNYPSDDEVYSTQMAAYHDYIRGSNYCVECCGTNPAQVDTWNFSCVTDFTTSSTSNLYGYEFRFAQKRFIGDDAVTSCFLERTGCQRYDGGISEPNCTNTYLKGYTLILHVVEYNENMYYWNGVTKCTVKGHELDRALRIGERFEERIIIYYKQDMNYVDAPKLFVLCVLFILLIYVPLYFCRRKHCIVCQKKLVLNRERCYMCIFVGAYPPDPVLFRALEDKGEHIQDIPPEKFPGATWFVALMRTCCALLCLRFEVLCCCFKKKKFSKIVPTTSAPVQTTAVVLKNSASGNINDESKEIENGQEVELYAKKKGKRSKNKDKDKLPDQMPEPSNSIVVQQSPSSSPVAKVKTMTTWLMSSSLSPSKNPNKLAYPPEIIYEAIHHHEFAPDPAPGPKNIPESAPGFRVTSGKPSTSVMGSSAAMRY